MSTLREKLAAQLARDPERPEAQLAMAQLCLREQDASAAGEHAVRAVALKPDYSAAYLLAGQAAQAAGDVAAAADWYGRGAEVAQQQGDKQIERQIAVFRKRLEAAS